MKTFNVTASIYEKNNTHKQIIFMNELVMAICDNDAKIVFEKIYSQNHHIVKIHSVEQYIQD